MNNLIPLIDSRKLIHPNRSIFYAISGAQNNGHHYIQELYQKGVRHFVIEDPHFSTDTIPEARITIVESTINALQKAATTYRNRFNIPIIGITGSNGKTIVKEWLSELLHEKYVVAKSPRSYNSQVGVPLSVFGLQPFHTIGIFEAGISQAHEMEKLQPIINPSIGILTNIGTAHDEGFEHNAEKIREKLILFKHAKHLIYRNENEFINTEVKALNIPLISWSLTGAANIEFTLNNHQLMINSRLFDCKDETITIPFTDNASVENICHCIAAMLHLQFSVSEINRKIAHLRPVSMRMEVKKAINNCRVIDDSYNNDLAGLQTALELFEASNPTLKRTVILSDVLQSGIPDDKLYQQVNDLLVARNVTRLIGVGKRISKFESTFKINNTFYASTEEMLKGGEKFDSEIILVKGARNFTFEKIVRSLLEKQHRATLEINLDALTQNLNFYRSRLKESTKIMVMVKAFAYGSGGEAVANMLQFSRIDYLAVAYADEGVELRKHGIRLPIMVMNPTPSDFENLVKYNLEPEIYSVTLLQQWISQRNNDNIKIHLKLDTGMHRLGVEEKDLNEVLALIQKHQVKVASVFSHLAHADHNDGKEFTARQLQSFQRMIENTETHIHPKPLFHLLNSSGILNYPEAQYDMVRLGIGLYGFDPTYSQELATVTRFIGRVSQVKEVQKGDFVGYGNAAKAVENMTIATINVGYADGFSRQFSHGIGKVWINNTLAPVFGNVCMDMIMVNVSGIACLEGDEVEIFGPNISIIKLADELDTIPYEILTSVSQRVKRIYFHE